MASLCLSHRRRPDREGRHCNSSQAPLRYSLRALCVCRLFCRLATRGANTERRGSKQGVILVVQFYRGRLLSAKAVRQAVNLGGLYKLRTQQRWRQLRPNEGSEGEFA